MSINLPYKKKECSSCMTALYRSQWTIYQHVVSILAYNNNKNIFIHTCYNCIEQYIPNNNNNIQRIIKHVMLNE